MPDGSVIISGIRKDPSIYGVYGLSVAAQPGVVAANNFMSLFNPVGSGRFVVIGGFFFSAYNIGATLEPSPMRGFRCNTATGGVDQAANIVKYDNRYLPPASVVRTGNPTCALDAAVFNSPPPMHSQDNGAIGTGFVHTVEPPPAAGGFFLLPGEGMVVRTAAGDVDQIWNITIVWGEGPGQ